MAKEGFWTSEAGITMRLKMLSEFVVWRTVNNSLQIYGSEAGADEFEWVTDIGAGTCAYCDSQSGRRYKRGQFMPRIPAHYGCKCFWDAHFKLS